jgi:transmembrane sensor
MSVRDDDIAVLAATEIDMRAAEWLQRRYFWKWCDTDQAALDAWLAESSAHEVAYMRLEAAWEATHKLAALQRPKQDRETPKRRRPAIAGIASGVIGAIVLIAAGLAFYRPGPAQQSYATALGQHKTVMLADGSHIELNTDSALRVAVDASGRHVWLDRGEAYFEIIHDARRPFSVVAGDRRVTDLGTKFVIRRDADRMSVALVEGRARVDATDGANSAPLFLKPGDVVEENHRALITSRKTAAEMKDDLGWRQGVLVFKHASVAEAAAEFNRYNSSKIIVADASAARISIGGTFKSDNVAAFAEAVRDLLGLHVENRGDETVISR